MKRITSWTACFLLAGAVYAQSAIVLSNAPDDLRQAYKKAYSPIAQGDLERGIRDMEKLVKKNPTFVNPYLILADANLQLQNADKAIEYFNKAVALSPDYEPRVYYILGQIYMDRKQFDLAATNFREYLKLPARSEELTFKARKMAMDAEFRPKALANPVPFDPTNLGTSVNTYNPEYFPSITIDENMMVYTTQTGTGSTAQEDLYFSVRENGVWSQGQPVPSVNTPENEGAQTISANGKTLVFTVCNRPEDFGSCDLYISEKRNNKWTTPKNIGSPINSRAWESQPSLSPHGDVLYFARGTTNNGTDLYYSTRSESGEWQTPQPISELNTPYSEGSPCMHPDGQTLYFASDGYGGMGKLDIYMAQKQANGKFGTPVNLGYPINTGESEAAMAVSLRGDLAYISSERAGGMGSLDIYSFELPANVRPKPSTYAIVKVFDATTKKSLPESNLEIINLATNAKFVTAKTDKVGEFLLCLPLQQDYALNIQKAGYLFYSENFELKTTSNSNKNEPFRVEVYLQPIPTSLTTTTTPNNKPKKDTIVSKPIVLKNVFFATNSAELRPESKTELDRLKKMLEDNPTMRIQINGHTDNEGDDQKNQQLSENRAKSVREYLIQQGIVAIRMTAKGFGETQPIDTNDTPQGRAANRRTEFVVLGN